MAVKRDEETGLPLLGQEVPLLDRKRETQGKMTRQRRRQAARDAAGEAIQSLSSQVLDSLPRKERRRIERELAKNVGDEE